MKPESRLEIVERQVIEAEAGVARQRRIIGELRREGHPASGSQTLLRLLNEAFGNYRYALGGPGNSRLREILCYIDHPGTGIWPSVEVTVRPPPTPYKPPVTPAS
jgi:hypothetical protein